MTKQSPRVAAEAAARANELVGLLALRLRSDLDNEITRLALQAVRELAADAFLEGVRYACSVLTPAKDILSELGSAIKDFASRGN
jgi:hypothetical protein